MKELHPMLQRQLKKLDLSLTRPPPEMEQWQLFLEKVNNSYFDADQDRYLMERSTDISSREMSELNKQLILTARQAGMAEIASVVLHNLGNILNSANLSLEILEENLNNLYVTKLFRIMALLIEHQNDLVNFLTVDKQGQLIPQYLHELFKVINIEKGTIQDELAHLKVHLDHINEIVSMQSSIGGLSTLIEQVDLPELIDTALNMVISPAMQTEITLKKEYQDCPIINTDKAKLQQILINLLQNARDSLLGTNPSQKKLLTLTLERIDKHKVAVMVKDTGRGINPANLQKVFTFGYTTKKHGHGFGLHSAALTTKELGGSLLAKSEGEDKGAEFILSLPITKTT